MEIKRIPNDETKLQELHRLIHSLPKKEGHEERMMTVQEVAVQYFDSVTPQSASRALRKEIREHPVLNDALALTGWSHRKRYFSPLQVRLLEAYLT